MSDFRAFRGVWIPAELWMARDLSLQEKVMLVEIDSLQDPSKGCFKSNKKLAEFFGLSVSRVSEIISSLRRKGYVTTENVREGNKVIERRVFMVRRLAALFADHDQGDRDREAGIRNPEGGIRNPEGGIRNPEGGYSESRRGYSENAKERGSVEGFSKRGSVRGDPPSSSGDDSSPSTRTAKAKRKHPLPDDFEPNDTCWQKAETLGVPLEVELEKFRDFHLAKGNKYVDWQAAFRNWLTKAAEFRADRQGGGRPAPRHASSPDWDDLPDDSYLIPREPRHPYRTIGGRQVPIQDDGTLIMPNGQPCRLEDWDAGRVTWDDRSDCPIWVEEA